MKPEIESKMAPALLTKAREFALTQEQAARKNMEKGEQSRSYHAGQAMAFATMAGILEMAGA